MHGFDVERGLDLPAVAAVAFVAVAHVNQSEAAMHPPGIARSGKFPGYRRA
jgi:hypothetical protein